MVAIARRFGIIAGSGQLPIILAKRLQERGDAPTIVRIAGQADPSLKFFDTFELPLEKIGYALGHFKKNGVTDVILAGGVSQRPKISAIRIPVSLWLELSVIAVAMKRGDDGLLAVLVKMLERHNISVVGAHEILPDHVAPLGVIVGTKPARSQLGAIGVGISAAQIIGASDIGQAVVSLGRRVIAVEGLEGTDQMLARIADLRAQGRINSQAQPVLIKLAKPGQELRADMPVIGPATIEGCKAAGIKLICVGAGTTMIMQVGQTLEHAKLAEVSVIGIDPLEWSEPKK